MTDRNYDNDWRKKTPRDATKKGVKANDEKSLQHDGQGYV
jgi:hypothetical protein